VTTLLRKIRQFRQLQPDQKKAFLIAVVLLPWFWLGLRCMGFSRLQAWLLKQSRAAHSPAGVDLARVRLLGEAVNLAARHTVLPVTCLTRSMLLNWLLHRQGVASELRIGVQINGGVFAAHAWVEFDGEPVNDQLDIATRFAAFGSEMGSLTFDAS
jgi:Transglutaminase-like superfamily